MSIRDAENKKQYFNAKNKNRVSLKFSPKEMIVLEDMMKKEEWENTSGFIKYKIFGDDPDFLYKKIITKGKPEDLVDLCRKELRSLNIFLMYIRFRYEKDMAQLYREEGVDMKKWIGSTLKWNNLAIDLLKDVYTSFREIASHLGIEISHESLAPQEEEHEYSDTEANDKAARALYENYQINDTKTIV